MLPPQGNVLCVARLSSSHVPGLYYEWTNLVSPGMCANTTIMVTIIPTATSDVYQYGVWSNITLLVTLMS